jgi:hypothetical protein
LWFDSRVDDQKGGMLALMDLAREVKCGQSVQKCRDYLQEARCLFDLKGDVKRIDHGVRYQSRKPFVWMMECGELRSRSDSQRVS